MFSRINTTRLLSIGLALIFLANGIGAFVAPENFRMLITHSFLYNRLLEFVPFYIVFIGYNDLALCFLLINRIMPREVAWWATVWILGVITVFLTQGNVDGLLSALEHGAPLGIALY